MQRILFLQHVCTSNQCILKVLLKGMETFRSAGTLNGRLQSVSSRGAPDIFQKLFNRDRTIETCCLHTPHSRDISVTFIPVKVQI